jgi:pimeloyl-ACP methyl ester carboxylesterase
MPVRSASHIKGGITTACLAGMLSTLFLFPSQVSARTYAIGHRSVTWLDPARGNRQVPTEVYYPADAAGDNVPLSEGAFPVVAFGHGYLMVVATYENIWTALVPNGFIVALPRTEGSLFPSHSQFGFDLAFLTDKLKEEGASAGSPYYRHIAATSAVMGHSMGGGASFLAAAANPRITALANLAAAETTPSAIAAAQGIEIPTLMFAGTKDCVTPPSQTQIPMYEALASSCKTLITITGASHCQFAEDNSLCRLGESCTADITVAEQHAIVDAYLVPWLSGWLAGDAVALQGFQTLLLGDLRVTYLQDCDLPADIVSFPAQDRENPGRTLTVGPNPFRNRTAITVHAGVGSRIEIVDMSGRVLRTLDGHRAGPVVWNGRDQDGNEAPSGAYFCRVRIPGGIARSPVIIRIR